jgi:hypothetical protein
MPDESLKEAIRYSSLIYQLNNARFMAEALGLDQLEREIGDIRDRAINKMVEAGCMTKGDSAE